MFSFMRVVFVSMIVICAAAAWAPACAGVLIQNPATLECMGLPVTDTLNGPLSLPCVANGLSQWTIRNGHIMSDVYQVMNGGDSQALCMDITGGVPGDPIVLNPCVNNATHQQWTIDRGHLVNSANNECMSSSSGRGDPITIQDCVFSGTGTKAQTWALD